MDARSRRADINTRANARQDKLPEYLLRQMAGMQVSKKQLYSLSVCS